MLRFVVAIMIACLAAATAHAAPPPPVEDYGKLPGIEIVSLSPSGQRYAMIAVVGDQRRVMVIDAANNPVDMRNIGATKVRSLSWAGDDHLLIFASETKKLDVGFTAGRSELLGCIVIDLKGRKSFVVFGGGYQTTVAPTVAGFYGVGERDGRWYGYFGGYTYDRQWGGSDLKTTTNGLVYSDLYRVDLDTGELKLEVKGEPGKNDWLVSAAGEVAARLYYNDTNGDWRVAAGQTGPTLLTGHSRTDDVGLLGFGRTGASLLVDPNTAGTLQEVTLTGDRAGAIQDLQAGAAPVFDDASRLWIGDRASGGAGAFKLFDPARQARVAGAHKAFPGYIARLVSNSGDFKRMVMFTDGGDDSGTYFMVDITKGAADQIGKAYPGIRAANVGPVRWFDYAAADGTEMRGVLTLPPGPAAKNLPLVVLPHGGPASHDTPGFDYWPQAYAARGYAVFQPNFRGSTGSGEAFRFAGHGQWGRKMQTDISDGVAALAQQGIVDPKRACIVGASYGGYAAMAGVTLQQGLYRCAVSYGGVSDLGAMLNDVREHSGALSSTMRSWTLYLGVTAASDPVLGTLSPARLADRADAPVLLIHGKDDTVVLADQSRRMEKALRAAGKPVEMITLAGADHWLTQEASRVATLKASVEFVMRHNPPDPAGP